MTKQESAEITSFLLTRSLLLNSIAQTAARDLKEHTMEHDKAIYHCMRNPLTNVIDKQQNLHDIYKGIIPKENFIFWMKLDEIVELIDKKLLEQ